MDEYPPILLAHTIKNSRISNHGRTALSDPKQTGGTHYLFDVHRAEIPDDALVTSKKEQATLVTPDEARLLLQGKQLEQRILEILFGAAA